MWASVPALEKIVISPRSCGAATALSEFRFQGKLTPDTLSGALHQSLPGQTSSTTENIALPREKGNDGWYDGITSLATWRARFDSIRRRKGPPVISLYIKQQR